jgi:osmoprotectant transport system ATP-binding protein
MLMDEPFGALDPLTRNSLQEEFRQLQKQLELTVVMVTHDMLEAVLLADRIAVMREGSLVEIGEPAILLRNPREEYTATLLSSPKEQVEHLTQMIHREMDDE